MRKVCVIGSINKDVVFHVDRFVRAKETRTSKEMNQFLGGKGLNQAIALSRAYGSVSLYGYIGQQDVHLLDEIRALGVDTSFVRTTDCETGAAFIQVDPKGENCILLNKGANHRFDREEIDEVLGQLDPKDMVVLQNEVNALDYMIERAYALDLAVALNPSPYEKSIEKLPLHLVDYLLVNEVEAEELSGEHLPTRMLEALETKYPDTCIVLTLGAEGALCSKDQRHYFQKSQPVVAADTTAAGDTFTGFFLGAILRDEDLLEALFTASIAAGISVSRKGATSSIPTLEEVLSWKNA